MRLSLEIKDTADMLVLGYRTVQVEDTDEGGGESTGIDVASGGPYLGISLGF